MTSTVHVVDDLELVARLQKGDESAFRDLVKRYHATLIKVARYYVSSDASAEDVAQDTWIAVMRGIESFEGRSSFKTWLLRICANRARTTGVKEHRSVPVDTTNEPSVRANRFDAGGAWKEPPVPFTEDVEFRLDSRDVLEAVRDAIVHLPDVQQAVVTLRDEQGLSTEEVAELLDLSTANVRVILHRGRARVRARIEETTRGTKI